jgi:hypothetical protein
MAMPAAANVNMRKMIKIEEWLLLASLLRMRMPASYQFTKYENTCSQ